MKKDNNYYKLIELLQKKFCFYNSQKRDLKKMLHSSKCSRIIIRTIIEHELQKINELCYFYFNTYKKYRSY